MLYLRNRIALFLLFTPALLLANGIDYRLEVDGVDSASTLKTIKQSSQLFALQKRKTASINALRYRANADIPQIRKVLRSRGFYEPKISIKIEPRNNYRGRQELFVIITIDPGPCYTIGDYLIDLPSIQITPEEIGVQKGAPALAKELLESEKKLIELLKKSGYPFAKVVKSSYLVNGKTKTLNVKLEVDPGRLCKFGKVTTTGLNNVSEELITKHLKWKKDELYSVEKVDETQKRLLKTGLFSSVFIRNDEKEDAEEKGTLPLQVEVTENKHRTINIGASYQTFFGPGLTFGSENRNIDSLGRKFSLQGELTRRSQLGVASFVLPDLYAIDQDYTIKAEASHESLIAYHQNSYSLLNQFDKKINKKRVQFSLGVQLARLDITGSDRNGSYDLAEMLLYFRWSTANSLLNPTAGNLVEYRITPSLILNHIADPYLSQTVSWSTYKKLTQSDRIVFSQKISIGSILSEHLNDVPISRRFLGGSEEEMRGYAYKTVSPLSSTGKPTGGSSFCYYTVELRLRPFDKIGFVPFFDLGSVSQKVLPVVDDHWLRSAGIGFRYFSFMGPLRCDIAFPLDRRAIDSKYRVLISLGQTF